jgi:hypothetical protein
MKKLLLLLALLASAANAATLDPVQFRQLGLTTGYSPLVGQQTYYSDSSPFQGGVDVGAVYDFKSTVYRYAAFVSFQLPELTQGETVSLAMTLGDGAFSLWDALSQTYEDASSGVSYATVLGAGDVTVYLTGVALADIYANSGGVFSFGITADRLARVSDVRLDVTQQAALRSFTLATPLPTAALLFLSALVPLLVLRRK